MDQRPHINRLKVSDSIVMSCRSFVQRDIDSAFLWALKVIEQANGLHLTDNEAEYLSEVFKKKKAKDRRNKN